MCWCVNLYSNSSKNSLKIYSIISQTSKWKANNEVSNWNIWSINMFLNHYVHVQEFNKLCFCNRCMFWLLISRLFWKIEISRCISRILMFLAQIKKSRIEMRNWRKRISLTLWCIFISIHSRLQTWIQSEPQMNWTELNSRDMKHLL